MWRTEGSFRRPGYETETNGSTGWRLKGRVVLKDLEQKAEKNRLDRGRRAVVAAMTRTKRQNKERKSFLYRQKFERIFFQLVRERIFDTRIFFRNDV